MLMTLLKSSTTTSLQNKMFDPGPRLKCAAELLSANKKIVDIGTDHAYLPAYLVLTGKSEDVLACDIGEMPLKNAAKTVRSFSLEDKITLRISDGLKEVSPKEAEEISICGMGGTLMSEILRAAPWIKRQGMHLVLQPMTHSEDVRQYLDENGFRIKEERFVTENSKVYCIISADYTGEKAREDKGFYYFGFLPPETDVQKLYVDTRLKRLDKKLNALVSCGAPDAEINDLKEIKSSYEKRMKDENM